MINIDIINSDIEKKSNTLSAIIKADSFFYGIFDEHQLVYAKTHTEINYQNPLALLNDPKLGLEYANISISVDSRPFLHVANEDSKILKYYPDFKNNKIYKESFTGYEVNTYFGITKEQNKLLKKLFRGKKFSLHHLSTALAHHSFPVSDKLLAHIEDNSLHLMSINNGQFQFYNQYSCNCKEDFLYYTLLVYDQLDRDPDVFPLTLSGAVDKISDTFQLLHGYIRYIDTIAPLLLSVKSTHPKHYYYNLYATEACG